MQRKAKLYCFYVKFVEIISSSIKLANLIIDVRPYHTKLKTAHSK